MEKLWKQEERVKYIHAEGVDARKGNWEAKEKRRVRKMVTKQPRDSKNLHAVHI